MADPSNKDDELNPGQKHADEVTSGTSAADLKNQEDGATPSSSDESVADQEKDAAPPSAKSEFVNNFTGKKGRSNGKKARAFLEGKGPLMVITGGVGLAGIGLLLLIPAFLIFHLLANLFDTYDPSSTALTQITKLMILNKLGANDATLGVCRTVKVACRFKTPSNELLRQLDAKGIKAYTVGADGQLKPMDIYSNSKWPTEKPSVYRFGTGSNRISVEPKDLRNVLASNTEFRIIFNQTVKKIGAKAFSRFSPAFLKVAEKFRLNLRDTFKARASVAEPGESTVAKIIRDALKIRGPGGEVIEEAGKAASLIASQISLRVSKLLTLVGKTAKGSGVVLAMALQCMVNEIPGMIKKTMVGIQQTAIVGVATPLITASSAIQAGDSDPQVVQELGTKWTEKGANGKTALDSIGVKHGLYHDKDTASDESYKNVSPSAFGTALDTADALLSNPLADVGCTLLMNPVSGAAIAAGINVLIAGTSEITLGASFVINLVIGTAMTALISASSGVISDFIGAKMAPILAVASDAALKQMSAPGQTFGNVFTAGLGIVSENTGAQTFGDAVTTTELAEYTKAMQDQQIADAEVDRATLSPLDASSRYTFLGSIVNQFLPYYGSLTSLSGGLSVIGSFLPISFGSVMKMSTASALNDPASVYTDACPNKESLKTPGGETLAANVFCQSVYGLIPSDDWNPNETVENMTRRDGAINDETGEAIIDDSPLATVVESFTDPLDDLFHPTVGYGDWLTTCTDPENASQCTGGNADEKEYALYTAGRTVSDMIDASPSDDAENDASSASIDFSDETVAAVDTENTDTEPSSSLFDLVSSIRGIFHDYKTTVASSAASVLTHNSLARFSLWR